MIDYELVERSAFTVKEIAYRNGVHPSTVNRWLAGGKLGSYKVGGIRRITVEHEQEFISHYLN